MLLSILKFVDWVITTSRWFFVSCYPKKKREKRNVNNQCCSWRWYKNRNVRTTYIYINSNRVLFLSQYLTTLISYICFFPRSFFSPSSLLFNTSIHQLPEFFISTDVDLSQVNTAIIFSTKKKKVASSSTNLNYTSSIVEEFQFHKHNVACYDPLRHISCIIHNFNVICTIYPYRDIVFIANAGMVR